MAKAWDPQRGRDVTAQVAALLAQGPPYRPASNRALKGDPLPGDLNETQESLVHSTGDSYWFFANTFGRDSYDGAGKMMRAVNNDPTISCPNANWNGETTNYCDGVSSDDVVAHEWGHAYTEYTNNLVYQWQSGALNESYSDIWGETVDLINGRLDEGEGDLTVKRPVGQCSTHSQQRNQPYRTPTMFPGWKKSTLMSLIYHINKKQNM